MIHGTFPSFSSFTQSLKPCEEYITGGTVEPVELVFEDEEERLLPTLDWSPGWFVEPEID